MRRERQWESRVEKFNYRFRMDRVIDIRVRLEGTAKVCGKFIGLLFIGLCP